MSYLLRLEAVNLSNVILDTNDLSTIRGGSLLLLNATEEVQNVIKNELLPNKFITITQGASWALFELQTDEMAAVQIKQKILGKLKEAPLCHATFVVDLLPKTGNYTTDRDCLHTLNRWQQMQSPSLSIPQPANAVCALDKVRPASKESYSKTSEKIMLSPSVVDRRNYGKEQKRGKFYESRTKLPGLRFTNDLDDLSYDPNQGILNGKIAVIYVDGNKFSQVVRACKNVDEQAKFDQKLREGQNSILKSLVKKANKDQNGTWKNNGGIRLETLLWGGDELIWVVPAWQGWQTLNLFFEQANEHIKIDKKLLDASDYPSKDKKLTFAAGLVFCHHNAPIHRITALAKSLAELPKQHDSSKNMVAYQILESFDHAGTDIDHYRKKRLANLGQPDQLLIAADNMGLFEKHIKTLKENDFPKRKSYQIITALLVNNPDEAESLQNKLFEDSPEIQKTLAELKKICGGENAHWLHLTDLWDFLAIENK